MSRFVDFYALEIWDCPINKQLKRHQLDFSLPLPLSLYLSFFVDLNVSFILMDYVCIAYHVHLIILDSFLILISSLLR